MDLRHILKNICIKMDLRHILKNMNIENYKDKFLYLKDVMGYSTNIVEVGAHYGEDSVRFSHFFQNANIYCFEPDPRNIQIFREVCAKVDKIKLFPYAISDKNEKMKFYQAKKDFKSIPDKYRFIGEKKYKNLDLNNSGSSSLKKSNRKDLKNSAEIEVDCITLSDWDKTEKLKNIDLLWIDVQGAEKDVLKGAADILHKIRFIQLEYGETSYEGAMNKKETYSFLNNLGFELIKDYSPESASGDYLFKNKEYHE
jgi:2-O-methyltransferase